MVTLEKQRSFTAPGDSVRSGPGSVDDASSYYRSSFDGAPRFSHSYGNGLGNGGPAPSRASSVQLTKEYCDRADEFTAARVRDALRRFEAHRGVHSGVVDRRKWKLFRGGGRGNPVACYRRIDAAASAPVPASKATTSGSIKHHRGAEVLAVGAVVGSVEDLLHGVVNLTPEAMQIESAMTQRDLIDSRVLGVVRAPTVVEPFRSLSLKWALRHHEELSRHRDYVFLEATGLLDEGDDKVGYHLVHSLAVPGAPPVAPDMPVVRGSVSYVFLYRQRSEFDVELFFQGLVHPMGSVRDKSASGFAAELVLATPSRVECGMMKKIAFSLRTRAPPGSHMSDPGTSATASTASSLVPSPRRKNTLLGGGVRLPSTQRRTNSEGRTSLCAVCRRHLRSFFGKAPPACELCDARACGKCRVAKRVFVFEDGLFHPAKMEFCTECVVTTTKLSAAWVAAQELALADGLDEDDYYSPESQRLYEQSQEEADRGSVPLLDSPSASQPAPDYRGRTLSHTQSAELPSRSPVLLHHALRVGAGPSSLKLRASSWDGDHSVSRIDEDRATMSSEFGAGFMVGSAGSGGRASQALVWLPSDRVRPTVHSFEPELEPTSEAVDVDAPPAGGLFVDDDDAIPMIDMPSESEGEEDEHPVADMDDGRTVRDPRRRPTTDLSYLY